MYGNLCQLLSFLLDTQNTIHYSPTRFLNNVLVPNRLLKTVRSVPLKHDVNSATLAVILPALPRTVASAAFCIFWP
jgi:hypothetical protein